eukprot:319124-Prymnesium_polylepis.1
MRRPDGATRREPPPGGSDAERGAWAVGGAAGHRRVAERGRSLLHGAAEQGWEGCGASRGSAAETAVRGTWHTSLMARHPQPTAQGSHHRDDRAGCGERWGVGAAADLGAGKWEPRRGQPRPPPS